MSLSTAYNEFLDKNDCLLLIVDIQKKMVDLCEDKGKIIKNVSALIQTSNQLNIPVIFSVHNREKLGTCINELSNYFDDPVILNKLEFSCFENEDLCSAIERTGKRTLILTGIETHVCIFHTGASGLRLGYRVHVAADAVGSRTLFNWKTGINRLEKSGAVISSTEMIIFELLNRAGTSDFRALLPLIKGFT